MIKPFFCYFGGKWRLAPYYAAPQHDTIIEPFAGAAGYSTRYCDRKVLLFDKDPVVCGVWDYLIKVSPAEVLKLPLKFDHVDEISVSQEAKYLIGFWLDKGGAKPAKRPSPRMIKPSWQHRPKSHWGPEIRERIASQVSRVKHWRVVCGDYTAAPNVAATWFVDPPYQVAGNVYTHGAKSLDYPALARWAGTRIGQVIVCENSGATWLPFQFFRSSKSTHKAGKTVNHEVIWEGGC